MAGNKTLHKAIERCDKRIARAKNKKNYSRNPEHIEAAENMIKEQESKKLRLQQQITMNNARKFSDVQRNKTTKGTERVQAPDEGGQGRDNLGAGEPW